MNCLFYNMNSKPIYLFLESFCLERTILDLLFFFSLWSYSAYILLIKHFLNNFNLLDGLRRYDRTSYQCSLTTIANQLYLRTFFSNETYASATFLMLFLRVAFINFGTCYFLCFSSKCFDQQLVFLGGREGLESTITFHHASEFLAASCCPFSGCPECWLARMKTCLHYRKHW